MNEKMTIGKIVAAALRPIVRVAATESSVELGAFGLRVGFDADAWKMLDPQPTTCGERYGFGIRVGDLSVRAWTEGQRKEALRRAEQQKTEPKHISTKYLTGKRCRPFCIVAQDLGVFLKFCVAEWGTRGPERSDEEMSCVLELRCFVRDGVELAKNVEMLRTDKVSAVGFELCDGLGGRACVLLDSPVFVGVDSDCAGYTDRLEVYLRFAGTGLAWHPAMPASVAELLQADASRPTTTFVYPGVGSQEALERVASRIHDERVGQA